MSFSAVTDRIYYRNAADSQSIAADSVHSFGHVTEVVRDEAARANLRAFGERVRQLRRAQNLTQEQLAHSAGMHRTIVGFIERGEREVGVSKVWPLAAALGVPPARLFESS